MKLMKGLQQWLIANGVPPVVALVLAAAILVAGCAAGLRVQGQDILGVEVERRQSGSNSSQVPLSLQDLVHRP